MTEHDEQTMVIQWAERHMDIYPELRWLYSSLNGIFIPGPRALVARIINHMKAEGLKKGVADLCLPVARRGYHGLYLELKKEFSGIISEEQKEFLSFIESEGYYGVVCHGYEETIDILGWYLGKDV